MARSAQQLLDELTQMLRADQVTPESQPAMLSALNRAKNFVVAWVEDHDRSAFRQRLDRAVAVGDAYVSLPTGTGSEPRWRRLDGAHEVLSGGNETPIPVYDRFEDVVVTSSPYPTQVLSGYGLVREKDRLYFAPSSASRTMTIRLRVACAVDDLDAGDLTAGWTDFLPEWEDVALLKAATQLCPNSQRDNMSYLKFSRELDTLMATVSLGLGRRNDAEAPRVRRVGDPRGWWRPVRR